MNKYQAIYQFWNSFGIPAFAVSAVPAQEKFPYITYTLSEGDFMSGETSMTVDVYYRTDTETEPNQKVFEIAKEIGYGGKILPYDGGAIWVKKGSPWCQSVHDEDDEKVKHRYLNVDLEYITMD